MRSAPHPVTGIELDEPSVDEWLNLAERTQASPFVHPGWIRAWRAAFGRGSPLVFAARRNGRLVGVVALESRRGGLRSPTNAHTPQFDLLVEDDEVTKSLAKEIFARGSRSVILSWLSRERATILRSAADSAGYRCIVRTIARSPYLDARPDLAAHERSLSRNLRHDVRRRLRRLCEVGAVSVQVSDGTRGLEALLEEGFGVEERGWKGARGTAIAAGPETRRFYTEVARWAASSGWLRLAFLRLDDRAIAFQFDLEAHETYYSLKIGYDPAYEVYSPGKLLVYTMAARSVLKGLSSYELLGAGEPWKDRWTKTSRERVALHAFAPSPTGYLGWIAFAHGRPLVRHAPFARQLAARLHR